MIVLFLLYIQAIEGQIITSEDMVLSENNKLNPSFQISPQKQCRLMHIFYESIQTTSRNITITNTLDYEISITFIVTSLNVNAISIALPLNLMEQQEIQIQPQQSHNYTINYICYQSWAYIELHIKLNYEFQIFRYVKLCEPLQFHYYPQILLTLIYIIFAYISSQYAQKPFKFKGYRIVSIDQLDSFETFQKVQQNSFTISKQPSLEDEVTETQKSKIAKQDQKVQIKCTIYVIFVFLIIIALLRYLSTNLIQSPILLIQFICYHNTLIDTLIYIVSSQYSPKFRLWLYGEVRLMNIFTLILTSLYMYFLILSNHWILANIINITMALQIVRLPLFYNLKSIFLTYLFIFFLFILNTIIFKLNLNQSFAILTFPNTININNPQQTCTDLNILFVILPSRLLSFVVYYEKQIRQQHQIFFIAFIGYIISEIIILMQNYEHFSEINDLVVPNIFILISIMLVELGHRNIGQIWNGIGIGNQHSAIKQQYSYELTIDKFNKI